MKIIQTLWTLPMRSQDIEEGRFNGGWISAKYNIMSIALSCLSLHKFYPSIELVTDTFGYNLINDIKLPYSKIAIALDTLKYPTSLWAIPKIYTYTLQNEPFLHVDNDIFIWENCFSKLLKHNLVVQNKYFLKNVQKEKLNWVLNDFKEQPACLKNIESNKRLSSVSVGLFGGSDIDFINQYASETLNFVRKNDTAILNQIPNFVAGSNSIFDEFIFCQMAKNKNKKITAFLPQKAMNYQVAHFNKVPFECTYIHLMSYYKKIDYLCNQVEFRLKYHFPEHYKLILERLEDKQFDETESVFQKAKNTYILFENFKDKNDILDVLVTLDDHIGIFQNEETFAYYMAINEKVNDTELNGWMKMLIYFDGKKITGNMLLKSVMNTNLKNHFSDYEIKNGITELILEGLVYHNFLKIVY